MPRNILRLYIYIDIENTVSQVADVQNNISRVLDIENTVFQRSPVVAIGVAASTVAVVDISV